MMKKTILLGLCLLTSLLVQYALAANSKPFVIPEVKVWNGGEGYLDFSGKWTIVTSKKSAEINKIGYVLNDNISKMFGERLNVSTSKSKTGNIILKVSYDKRLGDEGYTLAIDGNGVTITGSTSRGLYWGTRTLLQLLDDAQGKRLPIGVIRDWPDYHFRGAMLDGGRKFLPMQMLRDYVKILSYYKMNVLHIHLNDNGFREFFDNDWSKTYSAFRMECESYPGLTARDGYYTKKEFIDLQSLADSLGVEIIPEFDVPAHSLAFSKYKPEIGSKKYGMDHLDLFNPETYTFLDALFKEYIGGPNPVFRGKYMNIGTDEYSNADTAVVEKFRYFTNRYIKYVESFGKKPVLWGALTHAKGKAPVKVKDVLMYCWYNGYAEPDSMMRLGYDVVSIPDGYVYIVPKAGYYYDYLNTKWLYENWTPAQIGDKKFDERNPHIKGGAFAVWNDIVGNGISTRDIHYRAMPAIRTLATKMWTGANTTVPWDDFDSKAVTVREAPEVNYDGWFKHGLVYEKASLQPGDILPIDQIGWNYEVSFDIVSTPEARGTALFTFEDATFWLSDPVSGMLGFSRDGYLNNFDFQFYPNESAHVSIRGDKEQTQLLVNGKLVETLGVRKAKFGKKEFNYIRTLVFPLQHVGNSFKSKIMNLKVVSLTK